MNSFEFYNPVKIVFGKGKIAELPKFIAKDQRVLITYGGGSIKENGVYDQVFDALKGYTVFEFGGIEPNPKYETLMKAVALIRKEKIDFVLAVGGGSVIDGTKLIVAAVPFKGEPWDILSKKAPIVEALPFGAVLTLAATGSEMNSGAVITRNETKEKLAFGSPLLFPQFSILDPTTTFSLPSNQVANGIVDTFIHTTEQYLTYPVNAPIQDRTAEGILLTLIEEAPKAMASRNDYDVKANLMWSATMALNGLIGVGVPSDWATHMIGHELTAYHGLAHGVTLAIVLPSLLRTMIDEKQAKLAQMAERVWGITKGTEREKALAAIDKTEAFFQSLGVKTKLTEYGIGAENFAKIVTRFEERGWKGLGERRMVTPAKVLEILKASL
ncbi:iron-containing alcohol dehydrogenase [Williamwhitmania taraxaci]|uniref:NADP-dependent alcohol dehydrogenase n=1 Tax=Williamwhitmania taraxaci TaxID=1640674 RepID=A0A1G6H5A8_9BACT|nr:iron-containing alcohol dehydrogenase [Williamwhitmania taraxaci]SDB89439.1 NADP-dependent alcohol dehydrogenase [Williamwhitmania taraxaci]